MTASTFQSSPSDRLIVDGSLPSNSCSRRHALPALYLQLTKARLSAMVVFTTAVGFIMATGGTIDWLRLLWTVLGTSLVAGAANALNQLAEVQRDALMSRTHQRPLPCGALSLRHSFIVAMLLGYIGLAILAMLVNLAAAGLALLTLLIYIFAYTPLKTRTSLNTLVGAICGAIPPMIGWVGAAGSLDYGAWVLALLLFVWQIPHFLALAWLYRKDYERGGFAMLPAIDPSGRLTGRVVVLMTLVLLALGVATALSGLAGWLYAFGSVALGLWLLRLGLRLHAQRSDSNARRVFLASLVYLPTLLCLMVIDRGPAVTGANVQHQTASAAVTSDVTVANQ